MPDLVVTVPQQLWLDWVLEGDAAGEPASDQEWGFYLGGPRPNITVAWGLLRGYAPVTMVVRTQHMSAIACTIHEQSLTAGGVPTKFSREQSGYLRKILQLKQRAAGCG